MLHRRAALLLPVLALLPDAAMAGPPRVVGHPGPRAWRRDVSELRFGASGTDAEAWAEVLRRHLGVPIRAVTLQGGALARALDRGHLEFALLDRPTLSAARARMHRRLVAEPTPHEGRFRVARQVLPRAMREDLFRALA